MTLKNKMSDYQLVFTHFQIKLPERPNVMGFAGNWSRLGRISGMLPILLKEPSYDQIYLFVCNCTIWSYLVFIRRYSTPFVLVVRTEDSR